jgi:hypothetical protein
MIKPRIVKPDKRSLYRPEFGDVGPPWDLADWMLPIDKKSLRKAPFIRLY